MCPFCGVVVSASYILSAYCCLFACCCASFGQVSFSTVRMCKICSRRVPWSFSVRRYSVAGACSTCFSPGLNMYVEQIPCYMFLTRLSLPHMSGQVTMSPGGHQREEDLRHPPANPVQGSAWHAALQQILPFYQRRRDPPPPRPHAQISAHLPETPQAPGDHT